MWVSEEGRDVAVTYGNPANFPAYMFKASQFNFDFAIAIISCFLDSAKRSIHHVVRVSLGML